jgi:hypothetical protein
MRQMCLDCMNNLFSFILVFRTLKAKGSEHRLPLLLLPRTVRRPVGDRERNERCQWVLGHAHPGLEGIRLILYQVHITPRSEQLQLDFQL